MKKCIALLAAFSLLTLACAGFAAAEVTRSCALEALVRTSPELAGMKILRDSDSHYLATLAAGEPLGLHLPELSRRAVIQAIRAGAGE